MKKTILHWIVPILLVILLVPTGCEKQGPPQESPTPVSPSPAPEELTVASFNIQVFGKSKVRKPAVLQVLVQLVRRFDVVAVQELRDDSTEALDAFMQALGPDFAVVTGPREGRSNSKEQYAFLYRPALLRVAGQARHEDAANAFERPAYGVHFACVQAPLDFVLVNMHVDPDAARSEIPALPQVMEYFAAILQEPDVLLVGDLNADGSYFDEDTFLQVFSPEHFTSLIGNEADTTLAASSNTYDRIIANANLRADLTGVWQVEAFDRQFDWTTLGIEARAVSDHYPVWTRLYTHLDRD